MKERGAGESQSARRRRREACGGRVGRRVAERGAHLCWVGASVLPSWRYRERERSESLHKRGEEGQETNAQRRTTQPARALALAVTRCEQGGRVRLSHFLARRVAQMTRLSAFTSLPTHRATTDGMQYSWGTHTRNTTKQQKRGGLGGKWVSTTRLAPSSLALHHSRRTTTPRRHLVEEEQGHKAEDDPELDPTGPTASLD